MCGEVRPFRTQHNLHLSLDFFAVPLIIGIEKGNIQLGAGGYAGISGATGPNILIECNKLYWKIIEGRQEFRACIVIPSIVHDNNFCRLPRLAGYR